MCIQFGCNLDLYQISPNVELHLRRGTILPEAGPDEIAEQVRKHAWDWFTVHAAQRMQTFNFFLVATAFLLAAYGSLLEKHGEAAAVVALVGAGFAYCFRRLDSRTRQLVKASERVLKIAQARLAERSGITELNICEAVERAQQGASTYGTVITFVERTITIVFVLAAGYALYVRFAGGIPFLV
jgi:hypothetical protein